MENSIKKYYDSFGWKKNIRGEYNDTNLYVDNRPVLQEYYHKTHKRVEKYFKPVGEYFLDLGCGAIPFPELVDYSKLYHKRICVDFSETALREAKGKLGKRGLYFNEDISKLHFLLSPISMFSDTIFASHVLYHIQDTKQEKVVFDWYKLLGSDGTMIIIYSYPMLLYKILHKIGLYDHKTLYSYHYNYRWFKKKFGKKLDMEIVCWRSISNVFSTLFIGNGSISKLLLEIIYWLEDTFPHIMGRFGRYPMIIIRKKDGE